MSISGARAVYGLSAIGTATRTNTSGTTVIGPAQTAIPISDADIAYSFKVTSTGTGDVATLTFATGVVAQTTGTPTITDGSGVDFEGKTLSTPGTIRGIVLQTGDNTDEITVASGDFSSRLVNNDPSQVVMASSNLGIAGLAATMTITIIGAAGETVEVSVIAKTA